MADEESIQNEVQNAIYRTVDNVFREESSDALEAISVDRNRLRAVQHRLTMLVVRSTPVQQFGVGLGIGWISGYLFRRVSRTAAFILGCGFILVQGAASLGIISINMQGIKELARRNMQRIETHMRSMSGSDESPVQRLTDLTQHHVYLSSGFITGAVVAFTF